MTAGAELRRALGGPLLLTPDNYTHQMWGGDWIPRFKGLPVPGRPVGESWEISCHPARPSQVALGGQSLALTDLVQRFPRETLGSRTAGADVDSFPLLMKFIDARDDLSVQVHPADAAARELEHQSGKSEAWYVLDTGSGPGEGFVYAGFSPDKAAGFAGPDETAEAFLSALNQANAQGPSDDPAVRKRAERLILPFLNRIAVRPGDVIRLDPGTVHAIGRGVRLFEIQQNSDVTYRVWDWNRPDAEERKRGRLVFRALHLEKARACLDFDARPPEFYRTSPAAGAGETELIVETEGRFALSRAAMAAGGAKQWDTRDRFLGFTVIAGEVEFRSGEAVARAGPGRSVFVPASAGAVEARALSNAVLLRSYQP